MTQEKVALITGSSRGIGKAIAERLGADGVSVVVNYRSDAESAAKVVAKIEAGGGRAVAAQADVADPQQLRGLFDVAQQTFGGLDILVNNVGVGQFAPIAMATDEEFELHFQTNTRAAFVAMREAARRLREGGRIVVISSGIVTSHRPTAGLYTASKAAVDSLAATLAKEVGSRRITVNSVLPGVTANTTEGDNVPGEVRQQILFQTPLGRLGEPEDIADVVAFLASDQARWITGQTLNAGGGLFSPAGAAAGGARARVPGRPRRVRRCDPHHRPQAMSHPDRRNLSWGHELSVARKRTGLDRVRGPVVLPGTTGLTAYDHVTVSACHAHGKEEL
jgi:3-oxoacyl-[acyl-carrier protein] reductase